MMKYIQPEMKVTLFDSHIATTVSTTEQQIYAAEVTNDTMFKYGSDRATTMKINDVLSFFE